LIITPSTKAMAGAFRISSLMPRSRAVTKYRVQPAVTGIEQFVDFCLG